MSNVPFILVTVVLIVVERPPTFDNIRGYYDPRLLSGLSSDVVLEQGTLSLETGDVLRQEVLVGRRP